jgi:1-acyl-sn-glycerol-3-phosphate acyltransferase
VSGRPDGAEIISLDPARRARERAETANPPPRARCGELTRAGRPCRNYAGPSGYCRVHERQHAAGDEGAERRAPVTPLRPPTGRTEGIDVDAAIAAALAFLRRRLTGDYEVDVYGFDRELTEQVLLPLFRPLYRSYWRVRTVGLEHVPADSGALLVANHSGTLPFDAIMTKVALLDEHPARRHLRELAADLALRVPVVGPLARKTGNTLAHADDALRLLGDGELVGVWPEGFKGIGKPYRDRYKLQRFGRGGFVEVALRAQVPIIPVAIIGAEEIYPIIANSRFLARLFGLPYFPITWQFPLLGPLGIVPLPSRWVIEFGEPIDTRGYGPEAADDPMLIFELVDRVRDTIQQMLYRNLVGRSSAFF